MSSSQREPVSPSSAAAMNEAKCGKCLGNHPSGTCTNDRSNPRSATDRSQGYQHRSYVTFSGSHNIVNLNPNGVQRGGRRRNNRRKKETPEEKAARLEKQLEAARKVVAEKEKVEKEKKGDGDAIMEASPH